MRGRGHDTAQRQSADVTSNRRRISGRSPAFAHLLATKPFPPCPIFPRASYRTSCSSLQRCMWMHQLAPTHKQVSAALPPRRMSALRDGICERWGWWYVG